MTIAKYRKITINKIKIISYKRGVLIIGARLTIAMKHFSHFSVCLLVLLLQVVQLVEQILYSLNFLFWLLFFQLPLLTHFPLIHPLSALYLRTFSCETYVLFLLIVCENQLLAYEQFFIWFDTFLTRITHFYALSTHFYAFFTHFTPSLAYLTASLTDLTASFADLTAFLVDLTGSLTHLAFGPALWAFFLTHLAPSLLFLVYLGLFSVALTSSLTGSTWLLFIMIILHLKFSFIDILFNLLTIEMRNILHAFTCFSDTFLATILAPTLTLTLLTTLTLILVQLSDYMFSIFFSRLALTLP